MSKNRFKYIILFFLLSIYSYPNESENILINNEVKLENNILNLTLDIINNSSGPKVFINNEWFSEVTYFEITHISRLRNDYNNHVIISKNKNIGNSLFDNTIPNNCFSELADCIVIEPNKSLKITMKFELDLNDSLNYLDLRYIQVKLLFIEFDNSIKNYITDRILDQDTLKPIQPIAHLKKFNMYHFIPNGYPCIKYLEYYNVESIIITDEIIFN